MISSTVDPDGRRVVLREERWAHIKREHPYLRRRLGDVIRTVRQPDVRLQGRLEIEEWYLTQIVGRLPWLLVVVHYEEGEGWIVTAFRRAALPRS